MQFSDKTDALLMRLCIITIALIDVIIYFRSRRRKKSAGAKHGRLDRPFALDGNLLEVGHLLVVRMSTESADEGENSLRNAQRHKKIPLVRRYDKQIMDWTTT